jgi:hypothetical protein
VPFAKFKTDEGSIVLEFVGFGLLLQVPLLILSLSLTSLQHDELAAEAISRNALRSMLLLDIPPETTAMQIAEQFHEPLSRVQLEVSCDGNDCGLPGSWIHIVTRIGLASAEAAGVR